MHEDPQRALFKGKALHYSEKKMALAVWRGGGLPLQIMDLDDRGALEAAIAECEGVLFQGGADLAPETYGEQPLDPKWRGDAVRDRFEREALEIALAMGKPVLGICRGHQLINAALGGTLYQDIETQCEGALVHRDWARYEVLEHAVRLEADSWLAREVWPELDGELLTNTVHHQSVKALAPGLRTVGWAPDGIVEAFEEITPERWIVGVQWHPEWLDGSEVGGPHRTPGGPLFECFVEVCRERAG